MPQIRIKRGSGAPTSLAEGEPAWDSTNGVLYVGGSSAPQQVGGGAARLGAITGDLDTVLDQSICLATYLDGSADVVSIAARTQSGTCSVRLRRNSTALGSAASSVSSSARTIVDYDPASLVGGDELWLDITASSNVVGFRFSVWFDSPYESAV